MLLACIDDLSVFFFFSLLPIYCTLVALLSVNIFVDAIITVNAPSYYCICILYLFLHEPISYFFVSCTMTVHQYSICYLILIA